jgi:hypothetical protein
VLNKEGRASGERSLNERHEKSGRSVSSSATLEWTANTHNFLCGVNSQCRPLRMTTERRCRILAKLDELDIGGTAISSDSNDARSTRYADVEQEDDAKECLQLNIDVIASRVHGIVVGDQAAIVVVDDCVLDSERNVFGRPRPGARVLVLKDL